MSRISKFIISTFLLIALVMAALAIYLLSQRPAPAVITVPPPPAAVDTQVKKVLTVPVAITNRELSAGHLLQASDLKVAQWPIAPDHSFHSITELEGQHLKFDLKAGEAVLNAHLMQGLGNYLASGQRAISISSSTQSIISQRLQPGDEVDVFFTMSRKSGEIHSSQSRLLLSKVKLLVVGNSSVDGPLSTEKAPATAATAVTLAVPLADINALLLAQREGELQLVLRSPSDESLPNTALFPERSPLLAGKANLNKEELHALSNPENKAYAGDSLIQFAGPESETPSKKASVRQESKIQQHIPRTIEIIRGRSKQVDVY